MPLYVYCPFEGCGAKVSYDITKPVKCPRCSRIFADAFKASTTSTTTETNDITEVEEENEEERPLTRSALKASKKDSGAQFKQRKHPGTSRATISSDSEDGLTDEEEDEIFDPRAARRRARELAAKIDPASIIIHDKDEGVLRFEQFVEEARRNPISSPA